MRQFTTAVSGELNKRFGTEPLLIVEVDWVDDGAVAYSDQKINGADYPYPYLVSIGNFNMSTIITGNGESQNVNVTLNDIDGTLKTLLNSHDVHKRPVRVYLLFAGLPSTERVLLFSGVINSPIVWDEGSRTLAFDVFSTLEDREVAFTMEDGDFPFVPPEDRNEVWPLVFGQVCNMQTLPLTSPRKGFLAAGQGVKDPTIEERLCQAQKLKCPTKAAATTATAAAPGGGVTTSSSTNVRAAKPDQQCLSRRFNEICAILHEKEQQEQYVDTVMTVRGGDEFPQGILIDIKIDDVKFSGVMNGETFTITQVYHPALAEIDNPPCKDIAEASAGFRYRAGNNLPSSTQDCDAGGTNADQNIVNGSGESWRYYQTFESANFIWLPPGTDVFLDGESDLIHVVSLIPGTVNQVAAYRTFGDTTLLVEVPTARYAVHTVDYDGYDVVELRLPKALSAFTDENWSDDIYVSFTSSVGPNPVDSIEWLVEKYTDLTVDAASFASVKASLADYPSNFYIKERETALTVIRDIAFQARCAVIVRNNTISLVYLSKEPTSLKTLTESDIVANSFQVSHTDTDDLQTRHQINWQESDAPVIQDDDPKLEFVMKYNIPKYGVSREEYNYWTQNTFDTILKSATFWLIRKSHTWKYVEFETPLKHLNLEVFDCITLDIAQFPTVKCVIEEANYDADQNTIKFKCWTPILAGTDEPFFWAWPALQDANAVWPLVDSDESGDGYGFTVSPPVDHPLRAGYDADTQQVWTAGDRHPSDLDDAFVQVVCKIATGAEIAPDLEPVIVAFEPLADENFNDRMNDVESGGLTSDDKESKSACGDPGPPGAGCTYEVKVRYITPAAIAPFRDDVGTYAGPCTGQTGRPCFGPEYTMCHTFGAYFAASAFRSQKAAEARALFDNGGYQVGVSAIAPAGVSGIVGFPTDGYAGECEDTGNPDNPLNGAGETMDPGCSSGTCP